MTPPAPDPNIEQLHQLADQYRAAEEETRNARQQLDLLIQEMKRNGYSYPTLAKESGLAQGTIQNIVAKEEG